MGGIKDHESKIVNADRIITCGTSWHAGLIGEYLIEDLARINVEVEFVDIWTRRMREIQGAIILAGIFEAIIGISGVIGFVMRYIGPVTISPVICLIGLSVMDPAVNMAGQNWFVAVVCIITIITGI